MLEILDKSGTLTSRQFDSGWVQMSTEKYKSTPADFQKAESFLTPELKQKSAAREEAFRSLEPPRFDPEKGTIIFHFDHRLLDMERLEEFAQSEGFVSKEEYHITVVGFKNGRKIIDALKSKSAEEREETIRKINELIQQTDWSLDSTPKLYGVSKEYQIKNKETGQPESEKRKTIIQVLKFRGLQNFSDSLNAILGKEISPQLTHITLFTKGTHESSKMGIGIDTEENFNKLNPQPINLLDLTPRSITD